jgi:hypothetical protein
MRLSVSLAGASSRNITSGRLCCTQFFIPKSFLTHLILIEMLIHDVKINRPDFQKLRGETVPKDTPDAFRHHEYDFLVVEDPLSDRGVRVLIFKILNFILCILH